eukprot:CAMPEP_0202470008 /NCGR_PEP_ID=MMETSP1360-20130828/80259_1 /ASSEMBLY_ACC=CAM_ASM_000848 /TAXON_ID=515479 /ORGANISM="Licmophora paradoxa, Strain CCMP2313" /LENGTH=423 /DNA_ID=CAMNT_0049095559 /DNA_START=102 /DNA_END=1373 /DNA_ORIENTATION=-
MNTNTPQNPQPLSLSLCGNSDIADAGVAALAAAVRGSKAAATSALFRELDLSACGVGDAGAEALALALESHPACFDRLVLSHNKISDDGAGSIGNALAETTLKKSPSMILEIDGNKHLGDLGVKLLAEALGRGRIYKLSVRSCNIESDGMKDIAVALKKLALIEGVDEVHIDLSGNPIGTLRKKKKEKKYSASALKSKATETTASYLNFIGKKIQSGLKDVGLDNVANNFIPSGESDDDEEERMDLENGDYSAKTKSGDAKIIRCGAKAFADEMLSGNGGEETESESPKGSLICYLGLRRSFLDQSAGDALAAAIQHAKTSFGIDLRVDVELNDVLENDMLEALSGKDPDALEDMADRHLEAMEVIRMAEQRAAEAARAARARMQAHREAEDSFGGDFEFGDVEEFDDEEEEEFDDDDEDEDY